MEAAPPPCASAWRDRTTPSFSMLRTRAQVSILHQCASDRPACSWCKASPGNCAAISKSRESRIRAALFISPEGPPVKSRLSIVRGSRCAEPLPVLRRPHLVFARDDTSGRAEEPAPPTRILIVEDDYLIAAQMETALTDAGFDIAGIAASME